MQGNKTSSDHNSLNLVERNLLLAPVVELRPVRGDEWFAMVWVCSSVSAFFK